jgi:2-polyprenyl-6-methoxyphenol hydroxylase-like FAD-dependent oxidoreductase
MSTRARIAILGAGPGGTAFALSLLTRGVDPSDMVVIDKARFPRKKLCGGGVTFRGTELLESLVGRPRGAGETKGLVFVSSVGRFDVRERGPQWIYDRAELDHQLLEAVRARGVVIREGETVTAIEPAHAACAAASSVASSRGSSRTWLRGRSPTRSTSTSIRSATASLATPGSFRISWAGRSSAGRSA